VYAIIGVAFGGTSPARPGRLAGAKEGKKRRSAVPLTVLPPSSSFRGVEGKRGGKREKSYAVSFARTGTVFPWEGRGGERGWVWLFPPDHNLPGRGSEGKTKGEEVGARLRHLVLARFRRPARKRERERGKRLRIAASKSLSCSHPVPPRRTSERGGKKGGRGEKPDQLTPIPWRKSVPASRSASLIRNHLPRSFEKRGGKKKEKRRGGHIPDHQNFMSEREGGYPLPLSELVTLARVAGGTLNTRRRKEKKKGRGKDLPSSRHPEPVPTPSQDKRQGYV